MLKISFAELSMPKSGTLVLTVFADGALGDQGKALDAQLGGAVTALIQQRKFKAASGKTLVLARPAGTQYTDLVLLGLGDPAQANQTSIEEAGGSLLALLNGLDIEAATVLLDSPPVDFSLPVADVAAHLAMGAALRDYRFDKYRTREADGGDEAPGPVRSLATLKLATAGSAAARKHYAPLAAVVDAVHLARDLVSEPANELYPACYAERVQALEKLGLEVEVLDQKQLQKKGFKALLAVGEGSERDSALVVMRYHGLSDDAGKGKAKGKAKGKKKAGELAAPVAFVGKGITFDTGGISLKPPAGMGDMKWDMAGSAAVVGVMAALAGRKARVNAVGVIALAENMPSGKATRPGDIIGSLSGQSIEVLNTDAEGRLVLADALWYTEDRFKPVCMIDLATLTGAILVALGKEYAGLFTPDDELAAALSAAGATTGEKVWRMPLDPAYDKMLNTDAADMKNIGGRDAGSATAAHFLKRFVRDSRWAHLDIAGMAWADKTSPRAPKGATAYGVRLLDQLVRDKFEQ